MISWLWLLPALYLGFRFGVRWGKVNAHIDEMTAYAQGQHDLLEQADAEGFVDSQRRQAGMQ